MRIQTCAPVQTSGLHALLVALWLLHIKGDPAADVTCRAILRC